MSKQDDFNPDESIQSQGGKARAEKLSSEERTMIAKNAAMARWAIPKASHGGTIRIAQWVNIQCYNVKIGNEVQRMISQASFMDIIGVMGTGKAGANRIAMVLDNPLLPPAKTKALIREVQSPVKFLTEQNQLVYGYDNILVVNYCKAMMEARRNGYLPQWALGYAEACEKVVISLAGVALAALIDEATGFQEVRERRALEALLDRYLRTEFSAWAKRFPDEFYDEIYRLRGLEKGAGNKRPGFIGNDTNDIVYERLEVGLLKQLRERNPWDSEKKRRKGYHHCLLTDDLGVPALAQHLHAVISIMRGFPDGKWKRFLEFLDRTMPKKGDSVQFLLDLGDA